MEFLNIGIGELLLLALVGLLLFGPEDLLKFARSAGRQIRSLQRTWGEISRSVQTDLLEMEHDEMQQRSPPSQEAPTSEEGRETVLAATRRSETPSTPDTGGERDNEVVQGRAQGESETAL
ncbi:MAG: twin-arginine translocase TatA/TatE family subunit [Anaerolineales bacterium]